MADGAVLSDIGAQDNLMNATQTLDAWQALNQYFGKIKGKSLRDWFAEDQARFHKFSLKHDELLLDYSRHRIDTHALTLLLNLAHDAKLSEKIDALFNGGAINNTEKRPALHTALRDQHHRSIDIQGDNVAAHIAKVQAQMLAFAEKVHAQRWLGVTGKPIDTIVNVGIGGSYIGPMMATHALKDFAVSHLRCHFISTVDSVPLDDLLTSLNPETTLFIISSKSFTTIETLTNATTIRHWMQNKLGTTQLAPHFIAVTAAPDKARAFGIDEENIFALWDWVGGRYSVWSAIGLPILLLIGPNHYRDFLAGAHTMDEHFRQTDFAHNMPVIMALLGIWYENFFQTSAHAIIPYADRLTHFIAYLQQVDMESNGKSRRLNGDELTCLASPVIFGDEGCRGQHAYHQMLHQGKQMIPVDFILARNSNTAVTHQEILFASALSQAQALMRGKTYDEAYQEMIAKNCSQEEAKRQAKHRVIPGNRPSTILFLDRVSPKNLGALIALYEHKIFVQGVIWDINSFDQWGVELGKQLLPTILQQLQHDQVSADMDAATLGIIEHYRNLG